MKTLRFIFFLLLAIGLNSSVINAQQIRWLSFEQLTDSMRKNPKPVMIFIHTSWCKYCAMQESNTFTDIGVLNKLNNDFYMLKLNAEETSSIVFLNRTYKYVPSGYGTGYHELAEFLGRENGKLEFPTTIILTKSMVLSNRIQGFTDAPTLSSMMILNK